ncbi:hypothetical protein PT974_01699 [Cladobotryum mycophilum]|uniref:Uncharacterized protein n=1 Tax=Cladobotryum mycophilum TaxID=491253 RepID=A0ABR0SX45_9HYPO
MSDKSNPDGSVGPAAQTHLTRGALMELGLEEMRQHSESTDDISLYIPVANYGLDDDSERLRRNLEAHEKYGIDSFGSEWRERNRKAEIEILREADEMERLEKEARRKATTIFARNAEHKELLEKEPRFEGMRITIRDPSSSSSSSGTDERADERVDVGVVLQLYYDYHHRHRDADSDSADASRNRSAWRLSAEYRLLEDEHRSAARFRPEMRSLFHTQDMNAFTDEADKGNGKDPSYYNSNRQWSNKAATDSAVPSEFPPYVNVNGAVELATYLASASYIISLGGSPLPDLKYGIVIVPAGEESLLFSPDNRETMSKSFKAEVYAKSKTERKKQIDELMAKDMRDFEKAVVDYVNGIASEPDDDVREFYQQRWRTRHGYPDLPAEDRGQEPQSAEIQNLGTLDNDQDRSTEKDGLSNHHQITSDDASDQSIHHNHPVKNHEPESSIPGRLDGEDTKLADEMGRVPESSDNHQPHLTLESKAVTDLEQVSHETNVIEQEPPVNDHGADDPLPREDTLKTMDNDTTQKSEDNGSEANGHVTPAASVSPTLNKIAFKKPISPEARYALELRKIFLEVSQTLACLANGELRKNPGIHPRV